MQALKRRSFGLRLAQPSHFSTVSVVSLEEGHPKQKKNAPPAESLPLSIVRGAASGRALRHVSSFKRIQKMSVIRTVSAACAMFSLSCGVGQPAPLAEQSAQVDAVDTSAALSTGQEEQSFDFTDSVNRLPAGRLTLNVNGVGGVDGKLVGVTTTQVSGVLSLGQAVLVFKPVGALPVILQGKVNEIGSLSGKDWKAQRLFLHNGFLSTVENTFYLANGKVSSVGGLFGQFFKYGALSANVFGTSGFGEVVGNTCTVLKDGAVVLSQRVPSTTPFNSDYTEVLAGDAITVRRLDGSLIGRQVTSPADPFFYSADIEAGAIPLFRKSASIPGSSDFPRFDKVSLQRTNTQRVTNPAQRPTSETTFSVTPSAPKSGDIISVWLGWTSGNSKYESYCNGPDNAPYQINAEARASLKSLGLDDPASTITQYIIVRFSPDKIKTAGDTIITSSTQDFNIIAGPGFDPNIDPNAPPESSFANAATAQSSPSLVPDWKHFPRGLFPTHRW